MTSWLITGGAGFIGSNLVRLAARETNAQLVVLDALTYAGNLANIGDLIGAGRVVFIKGDVCDGDLISGLFSKYGFSCVAHLAAESHVDRSILGPLPFIRTNIEGTCVLLEAARSAWRKDLQDKRFLHVSTDEVFGSLAADAPAFSESSPYQPNSPYSASKAAADHLARAWSHTYGLPVITSNCSNNYGPFQFPEKLIPLMILNAVDEVELPVYGDGLQIRDWLHVEDHCRALLLLIARGQPGRSYMVGGDCERTNMQIVNGICTAVDCLLGRPEGTARRLIRQVTDRPGHDRRYAMCASLMKSELGWQPRHSLEVALPQVVQWYLDNRAWVDAVRSGQYRDYYKQQYKDR